MCLLYECCAVLSCFSHVWVFVTLGATACQVPLSTGFSRQEEKGMTEDEMVGLHHWLDEHRFGWTPGVGDGQGGLACCGSWSHIKPDTTEWLNWTELNWILEWFGISFSWGSSWPRDQTWVSCTPGRFFHVETLGKLCSSHVSSNSFRMSILLISPQPVNTVLLHCKNI